jgi:ABC-type polysaccharide/polyol phosphate export permease
MAFFVVPIFYAIKEISPRFRWIVAINPMSQIIIFSRDILLYHKSPPPINLIGVFVFSFLVLTGGYVFFKQFEFKIAERV